MKTLISLGLATFVLGFVFSAELIAGEKETEDRLIKDGWKKLSTAELMKLKDYTGVSETGWAVYVDPTGTNLIHQPCY